MMKNESNATMSQHLCLIIYGMARTLPTKYNLDPFTVSTYNVMKYATHRINDEQMRVLFSMSQDNLDDECIVCKRRMLLASLCHAYPEKKCNKEWQSLP
jgi:hypothetical protein